MRRRTLEPVASSEEHALSGTLNKILYVEDEPDIQAVAKLALEAIGGFTVNICGSGQEALAAVGDFNPDVILLDVMMPEMDGPTTLKALRKVDSVSKTPVIFMTAKVQPQEVAHYRELGAVDVIAKPFDPMGLSAQVRSIWERQPH
jgi:two-component system OmpR family response regulator